MKDIKNRDGKTYAYSINKDIAVGNDFSATCGLGSRNSESDIGIIVGWGREWMSFEDALSLRDALTKCISEANNKANDMIIGEVLYPGSSSLNTKQGIKVINPKK